MPLVSFDNEEDETDEPELGASLCRLMLPIPRRSSDSPSWQKLVANSGSWEIDEDADWVWPGMDFGELAENGDLDNETSAAFWVSWSKSIGEGDEFLSVVISDFLIPSFVRRDP